jgi:hypothetical protein
MTLNLSPQEMELVEEESARLGTTKTGFIRSALRQYQGLLKRVNEGDGYRLETRIVDKDGNEVSKIMYIE